MSNPIAVRFLLDDGSVQQGELVNPFHIEGNHVVVRDHLAGVIDIVVTDFDGTPYATQVHISRVSAMREEVVPA